MISTDLTVLLKIPTLVLQEIFTLMNTLSTVRLPGSFNTKPSKQPVLNRRFSYINTNTVKKILDPYPAISGFSLTIQLFLDFYPEDNNPEIAEYFSR